MLERTTKTDRTRWRRYRARRDAGIAVALVSYDADVLTWLVELHWLAERDAGRGFRLAIQ